jgi:hypothetical protein
MLVASGIFAARSKLFAQENISDAVITQRLFQLLAVELRIEATIGRRSDIAKRGDAVLPQQSDETHLRVRRMSDRENSFLKMMAEKP